MFTELPILFNRESHCHSWCILVQIYWWADNFTEGGERWFSGMEGFLRDLFLLHSHLSTSLKEVLAFLNPFPNRPLLFSSRVKNFLVLLNCWWIRIMSVKHYLIKSPSTTRTDESQNHIESGQMPNHAPRNLPIFYSHKSQLQTIMKIVSHNLYYLIIPICRHRTWWISQSGI